MPEKHLPYGRMNRRKTPPQLNDNDFEKRKTLIGIHILLK